MANSKVQFIETTSAKLDSLPITDGRFTFTTDTKRLYRDTGSTRTCVNDNTVPIAFSASASAFYITVNSGNVDVTISNEDTLNISF